MCQEYEKMWHALSKDWFCPATRQFVERMASSERSPRGVQNVSTSLDFVTGANLAQYTAFFDHWSSRPRIWDLFASAKEVVLCRTCNSRARVQSQSKSDLILTWYSCVQYDYDGYENFSINHRIYMNPPKLELCLKDRYSKHNSSKIELLRSREKSCREKTSCRNSKLLGSWIPNGAGEDFLGTVNQTVEETLGPPEKAHWALWISGRFYVEYADLYGSIIWFYVLAICQESGLSWSGAFWLPFSLSSIMKQELFHC